MVTRRLHTIVSGIEHTVCSKCKATKPIDQFSKNKNSYDKLTSYCKVCLKKVTKNNPEYQKQYRLENKLELVEYHKNWCSKNKDKIVEYSKEKYCKNRNWHQEYNQEYRNTEKHKQAMIEYQKKYKKLYPVKYSDLSIEAKEHNKHCSRLYKKLRRGTKEFIIKETNYKRIRRGRKESINEKYLVQDYNYTMELFESSCANCGSIDDLCIDHHLPLSKGNALSRTNAAVLCRKCNSSKGAKSPEDFYTSSKLYEIEQKLFHLFINK